MLRSVARWAQSIDKNATTVYNGISNKESNYKPPYKMKGDLQMNSFGKFLMTIFIILYVVSPVDACPGPIDDIIVILLGMALKKGDRKLIKD